MESPSKKWPEPVNHSGKLCRKGMTLIELLISLSIIAMMTAVALPNFSYYQKRNLVSNDIEAFIQLFNYARALQNNPDNVSRIADQNKGYNYVIKFTNINKINRATLYASLNGIIDESYPIDKVDFSEDFEVIYRHGGMEPKSDGGNGLILTFSGKTPNEKIDCSVPDQIISYNCNMWLKIKLNGPSITKSATITNTFDWAASNTHTLLSIKAD